MNTSDKIHFIGCENPFMVTFLIVDERKMTRVIYHFYSVTSNKNRRFYFVASNKNVIFAAKKKQWTSNCLER